MQIIATKESRCAPTDSATDKAVRAPVFSLGIIAVAKGRAGDRIVENLSCFIMTDPSFNDRDSGGESHPKTLTTDGGSGITRRDFVQSVVTTSIALGAQAWAAETKSGEMIYRVLGRTGEKVSAIG